MRLHLKNLDPEIHALIVLCKAETGLKNLDDTVAYLIQLAMVDYPDKISELENMLGGIEGELKDEDGVNK